MSDEAIEQLRWSTEQQWTRDIARWEQHNKPWVRPGTRNHREVLLPPREGTGDPDPCPGVEREVYDDSDVLPVEDDHAALLPALVVGRTIVAAERELPPPEGDDWGHASNDVTLTLDDGSKLHFSSWGHDADGCATSFEPVRATSERKDGEDG